MNLTHYSRVSTANLGQTSHAVTQTKDGLYLAFINLSFTGNKMYHPLWEIIGL
jgi:hypothetical protein